MKKHTGSIYLGKAGGTALYLHWSFLVLVVLVFFSNYRDPNAEAGNLEQGVLGVLFILAIFTSVTLHEFGHITVARRYDCPAESITLYPIGGMARMQKIPEKPAQELWMALAGPWVNVMIAAVLYAIIAFTDGVPVLGGLETLTWEHFPYNLMMANIMLATFNLLPAFPMDGGRVLRALLAMKLTRVRATVIAARIGQLLAVAFFIAGFFFNIFVSLIGIFIYFVAGQEMVLEMTKAVLQDYKVKDAMMRRFTSFSPDETIASAVQTMLDVQETEFVVIGNGQLAGVVTSKELIKGLLEQGRTATVSALLKQDVITLDPEMPLSEAFQKMMISGQTIYPVTEAGKLAGIIDVQNINEFSMVKGIENKEKTKQGQLAVSGE